VAAGRPKRRRKQGFFALFRASRAPSWWGGRGCPRGDCETFHSRAASPPHFNSGVRREGSLGRDRARGAHAAKGSREEGLVGRFVEADQYRLAHQQGRRAQVAGGPEHGLDALGARLAAGLELVDVLALGDDDPGGSLGDPGRVLAAKFFRRGNDFDRLDAVGVQKLGRFDAGGSTVAVVIPVGLPGHRRVSFAPCSGAVLPAASSRRPCSGPVR